jgi:hypothetical protein
MNDKTKLQIINDKVKKLQLNGVVKKSTRKNKKYMFVPNDGSKKIHFGDNRYSDFLDNQDDKRRQLFHTRFKNNESYNDKNSALWFSVNLLW